MTNILVVDDEPRIRSVFKEFLEDYGYTVIAAEDGLAAQEILLSMREASGADGPPVDVILCDLVMPRCGGAEFFVWLRTQGWTQLPFICISGRGDLRDVVSIIQKGAFDFISKPVRHLSEIATVVERAVRVSQHTHETLSLESTDGMETAMVYENVVGRSPKFLKVAQHIAKVAPTLATVLITGESGTGKEVVARTIHGLSPCASGPFVAVNCAAIPENLIESELFGYEKGAFTGAYTSKQGKFHAANGGTLFLDEVGEFELGLQSKLLRVIQERVFEPVGSTRSVSVSVRILAATNRDLKPMVDAGLFRQDLWYRLNVFPLHLPPLRDRKEDILPLVRYFASMISARMNIPVPTLSLGAFDKLREHAWPGNIRELENAVERAIIESSHGIILPDDIPLPDPQQSPPIPVTSIPSTTASLHNAENNVTQPLAPLDRPNQTPIDPNSPRNPSKASTFSVLVARDNLSWDAIERETLTQVLVECNGNISNAARMLHLTRSHLRSRLRYHNLGK